MRRYAHDGCRSAMCRSESDCDLHIAGEEKTATCCRWAVCRLQIPRRLQMQLFALCSLVCRCRCTLLFLSPGKSVIDLAFTHPQALCHFRPLEIRIGC